VAKNGRSASPGPPDLLGPDGRAQLVAQKMLELQRMRFNLDVTRAVNGHEDSDRMPLPGIEAKDWPTYDERRADIEQGISRLWDLDPSLEERVRQLVADAGNPSEQ
jgi:hypothetical protein